MFTKVNNQSPFTIKNNDLTKSASWNTVAQDRFKRQHKDPDNLPEDDHHAVPKQNFGPTIKAPDEKEMQTTLENLQAQIQQLKQSEQHKTVQVKEEEQPSQKPKDEFYDDWLDE